MNMIELEPGMRVRCVDAYGTRLRKGREYTVEATMGDYVSVVGEKYWHRHRFKPVIRVKAGRSTAFSTTHDGSAPPVPKLIRSVTAGPSRGMTYDETLDLVINNYQPY